MLAIADDPSIALSVYDDRTPASPLEAAQHHDSKQGEDNTLARADSVESTSSTAATASTAASRASSQTLTSQLSGGGSFSSASKAAGKHVSIADLRAQAEKIVAQNGHEDPIAIEDGEVLAKEMSGTLSFGGGNGIGLGPDFGSDDSDGPPLSEGDEDTE